MQFTDKRTSQLAKGKQEYQAPVVVTESLIYADIALMVDKELLPGTISIDYDRLPWWRRLSPLAHSPLVGRDRIGNLRIYPAIRGMSQKQVFFRRYEPGIHQINELDRGRKMSLTITVSPDVAYANV